MCECVCSLWSSLLETKKQLEINLHSQARASVHMYTHTLYCFYHKFTKFGMPTASSGQSGRVMQITRSQGETYCILFVFLFLQKYWGSSVSYTEIKQGKCKCSFRARKKTTNPDGVLVIQLLCGIKFFQEFVIYKWIVYLCCAGSYFL